MSRASSTSRSISVKQIAAAVSLAVGAILLLLPQTQQALPRSVRSAEGSVLLKSAARILPGSHDFWHTDGNRILDSHGHPVRIAGMNWSGLETKQAVPGGLQAQDYRTILQTIQRGGYNVVRIPFSNEMVEAPQIPDGIRFSGPNGPMNTDLRGLDSMEILDRIIAYSGKLGLKVILDNHRSEAGSSAEESGLWYTDQYPESRWIEDWTILATLYKNNSTVIGMDLRNEPHNADKGGACWDCGGANDWHLAAQRAGNAVLAINPRLLIFVEGVDAYQGDSYWWGGNLEGVRHAPVRLNVANRLVYSVHEYGPTEYSQSWFNLETSPASLARIWRQHWAYVSESHLAPVWIGEFGTTNDASDIQSSTPGSEGQWFSSLIAFLGAHPAIGWTYWGVNGEDRYALLDASYTNTPVNQGKANALAGILQSSQSFAIAHKTPSAQTSFESWSEGEVLSTTSSDAQSNRTSQPAPTAVGQSPIYAQKTFLPPTVPHVTTAPREAAKGSLPSLNPPSPESIEGEISASVRDAVASANQHLN